MRGATTTATAWRTSARARWRYSSGRTTAGSTPTARRRRRRRSCRSRSRSRRRRPGVDTLPAMDKARVYAIRMATLYPLYVRKAEAKGRTKAEVDQIIFWLTGHTAASLKKALASDIDLKTFYAKAPRFQ